MARFEQFGPVNGAYDPIVAPRSGATVIAVDAATLTDTYLPADKTLNCLLYETIFVGVEITGGTNPTMTIEPLFYDKEAPAASPNYVRIVTGPTDGVTPTTATIQSTGALASNANFAELKVFGHPAVFLRISAVGAATNTTAWSILAMPGKARNSVMIPRS